VEKRPGPDGALEAHTTNRTYFSRLADAETFICQAYVEAHRRGTETVKVVCAVQDGAEWLQGLVTCCDRMQYASSTSRMRSST